MNKTLKIIQCLFFSGVILMTSQRKSEAFFLIPPLPPSVEVDIPGNVGKVVSNLKAVYKKAQTIASELNSINLDAIKGCITGGAGCDELMRIASLAPQYRGMPEKTPGKGKIVANTELGIAEGDTNEFNYYNAYHQLFFTYPNPSDVASKIGGQIDNRIIQSAYKSRAMEYKQDVLIDTYLAGRLTESYLVLVEKTINRLDLCQKGIKEGKDCVFFGMQMDKVGTDDGKKPDADTPSAGQIGAAKNAYIVTMVYDRLMSIVEDLTATEAIYRASKQIDLGAPVNESSAEKYIKEKYRFVHTDVHENAHAAGLISKRIRLNKNKGGVCETAGGKGCPDYNKSKASLINMDNTEILEKLQPVDDALDKATLLHNFKVQLPDYKTQYRRYLKAIEVHRRALAALEQSDKCVIEFLNTYGANTKVNWTSAWRGNITKANDHDNRLGISRALIEEYQDNINETIIGNTSACPNYYESCPDGYYLDTKEICEDNGRVLHPCSIETLDRDLGDEAEPEGTSLNDIANGAEDVDSNEGESDYLLDASGADKINQSNRLRGEETWQLGSKKMVELTKAGTLKFEPWNDQQQLQEEYLRNKYRNIKLIIQSIDQGIGSYKIAAELTGSADNSAAENLVADNINQYIEAISRCMSTSQARQEAQKQFCTEAAAIAGTERNCTVRDNNNGTIKGRKEVMVGYDEDGRKKWEWVEKIWNQRVSLTDANSCYFKKTPQTLTTGGESQSCNAGWDLTVGFLVKNYLPKTLGGCKASRKDQATNFYSELRDKGRIVAQSKLDNVLKTREVEEQKMVDFIRKYEAEQQTRRDLLKYYKDRMSIKNASINASTKTKNTAQKELNRSVKRIKAIKDESDQTGEWYDLDEKKAIAGELVALNTQPGETMASINAFKCTTEKQQQKLLFEIGAIQGKSENVLRKDWKCPKSCELAAKESSSSAIKIAQKKNELCKENLYVSDYRVSLTAKLRKSNPDKDEKHYVSPDEAKARIATESATIKRLKKERENIKKKIAKIEEEIEAAADKFGEDYVDLAESNQQNIEKANTEFESFLEKQEDENKRMENGKDIICLSRGFLGFCTKHGPHPYEADNLSATIIGINNKKDLEDSESGIKEQLTEIIKQDMNKIWWESSKAGIISKLNTIGIPTKFFTDDTFNIAKVGKLSTVSSATEVAEKVKDMIITLAAEEVTKDIISADKIMKQESDKALRLIDNFVSKNSGWDICTECSKPSSKLSKLMNPNTYGANGELTKAHQNLINNLQQPINGPILRRAGVDLSEVMGIPGDEDLTKIGTIDSKGIVTNKKVKIGTTDKERKYVYDDDGNIIGKVKGNDAIADQIDSEYFVGLPARGTISSLGQKRYAINDGICTTGDCSAGRDFRAPRGPLLNLPPVREVFYFSSADYQEIPKDKRRRKDKYYLPSIPHLLNLKYPNDSKHRWEYLPETWRYLLARPNLRNDGKYQHTFVERSLKGANLSNLLENLDTKSVVGAKQSDYYAITARSGVYPCWTKPFGSSSANKVIIDIDGGAGVGDMQFKYRTAKPSDIGRIGECKEVAYNSAVNSSCYTYNWQGKTSKKRQSGICHLMADHGQNKDVQTKLKLATNTMHSRYSELGQFLSGDLKYRPLQQNILEFLSNEKNTANDINRQKAETASYKRNLFGSFLEAVNTEYTARKNLEAVEEEINNALLNLCKQIHDNGHIVIDSKETESEEECVAFIKSHGGLASSAEDVVYGQEGEYDDKPQAYKGVNCKLKDQPNYYNQLYCDLHTWKKNNLYEAISKYTDITKHFSKQEKNRVKERLDSIENTIRALSADEKEVLMVTSNVKCSQSKTLQTCQKKAADCCPEINKKLVEAKTDRTVTRKIDGDGIVAMDNQSQVVPYCPVYRFK